MGRRSQTTASKRCSWAGRKARQRAQPAQAEPAQRDSQDAALGPAPEAPGDPVHGLATQLAGAVLHEQALTAADPGAPQRRRATVPDNPEWADEEDHVPGPPGHVPRRRLFADNPDPDQPLPSIEIDPSISRRTGREPTGKKVQEPAASPPVAHRTRSRSVALLPPLPRPRRGPKSSSRTPTADGLPGASVPCVAGPSSNTDQGQGHPPLISEDRPESPGSAPVPPILEGSPSPLRAPSTGRTPEPAIQPGPTPTPAPSVDETARPFGSPSPDATMRTPTPGGASDAAMETRSPTPVPVRDTPSSSIMLSPAGPSPSPGPAPQGSPATPMSPSPMTQSPISAVSMEHEAAGPESPVAVSPVAAEPAIPPVAAPSASLGLDEDLNRDAATQALLGDAWAQTCGCDDVPGELDGRVLTLREWNRHLISHWPCGDAREPHIERRLTDPRPLPRDGRYGDYQRIAWRALLSGGAEGPPSLDLGASCIPRTLQPTIRRDWDVDSVIAVITSLGAHRGGFDFAYRPPYLRRVTQNPYVRKFHGRTLHRIKNMRIGSGMAAGGYHYECHVFFPHMPVVTEDGTHPTDAQQEFWVDEIVLPALAVACSPSVRQHHPRSFAEVDAKARSRKEIHPSGSAMPMDVRHTIPDTDTDSFWQEVTRRCNRDDGSVYRDVFLVVSGHGLKLFTKRERAEDLQMDFMHHLRQCFYVEEHYMPSADTWIDLGMEDTPDDVHGGVTLLHRTQCLAAWVAKFEAPDHPGTLMRADLFPWALTRDAGSATVELRTTNSWNVRGGLAYHKAYNLNKDMFATLAKGLGPFDLQLLEGLVYDQELMDRWYELNSRGAGTAQHCKRSQLRQVYEQIKERLRSALEDTAGTCFGARQEYRMTMERFGRLTLSTPDVGGLDPETRHRPYHVLSTAEVNRHVTMDLERWLLCLEVLMTQAERGGSGLRPVPHEQQMLNGVMAAAIFQTLQASLGAHRECQNRSLWEKDWKPPHRKRAGVGEGPPNDEDEGAIAERWGLNYRFTVSHYGKAWFADRLILWEGLPVFHPAAMKHLSFNSMGFGRQLRQPNLARRALVKEQCRLRMYRDRLVSAWRGPEDPSVPMDRWNRTMEALKLGAELVLQAYLLEVLAVLRRREASNVEVHFDDMISKDAKAGLVGLSLRRLASWMGRAPHIALVKTATRNGTSVLGKYLQGNWGERLDGLLATRDQSDAHRKLRGWHHSPFRALKDRLRGMALEVMGETRADHFELITSQTFQRHLWIIPQYDLDKLSVLRKPSKHNSQESAEAIAMMDDWERTNWIVPQLPPERWEDLRDVERDELRNLHVDELSRQARRRLKARLTLGASLAVMSEGRAGTTYRGLVQDPECFGVDLVLHRAKEFQETVEMEA